MVTDFPRWRGLGGGSKPKTHGKSIPPKQLPLQQKPPAFCQQPDKKHDKGRSLLMEVHTSPGKPSISCLVPTIIARAVAVPQAIAVVVLLKQTIFYFRLEMVYSQFTSGICFCDAAEFASEICISPH
ncbi:MAG: hypothetical protein H6559_29945 [Lewinellaceae bacterium]|nr:hypothetical protein [Lewinellaceae bacterium]